MRTKRMWALLLGLMLLLLAGCEEQTDPEPEVKEPDGQTETEITLTVEQRTLIMESGGEETLVVESNGDVTFSSNKPEVVSVDEEGHVTALRKGNAMLTVSAGDQVAYCGVMVDLTDSYVDLHEQEMKALVLDLTLERYTVPRDMDVDMEQKALYFVQTYGNAPSDLLFTKVELVDGGWERTEWMHLYESGYGLLSLDHDENGDVYLWSNSNGNFNDEGATISRVAWEHEGFYQQEYGLTMDFGLSVEEIAVDEENDLVVLRTAGEMYKNYIYYDRESLLAGEEPIPLYTLSYSTNQTPTTGVDDSNNTYSMYTNQDFTVCGRYIYQLNGQAEQNVYISVFDIEGNFIYCRLITEYEDISFREPESLTYDDGKIYVVFASGESGNRWSNVFFFE